MSLAPVSVSNYLHEFLPLAAVTYCAEVRHNLTFDLLIKKPRRSKLGDFTLIPGRKPRITVNKDLNNYHFLITFLHEVAHLVAYSRSGNKKIDPHGKEWKNAFRELLRPMLNEEIFPGDILAPLMRYAQNPKASTSADRVLYSALRRYDNQQEIHKSPLSHLKPGAKFVFRQRVFVRMAIRRTRILCIEKSSNLRYTIPAHALVEVLG